MTSHAVEFHDVPQLELQHRDSVLGRISCIIDAFDATTPVLSLGRLTERTGLPKSTVYRMTEQLVALRWLERTMSGYRLGLRLFEIGGLVASRNRLRSVAMPHLQDLRSWVGHSVHMGVLDDLDVMILAKIWGNERIASTWDGGRMPAHCTATGKVLLAYSDDATVQAAIDRGLRRRTRGTIVNPMVLRKTLGKIVEQQYATESEENVAGVCCVAAPILYHDRCIAAVSVSGPLYQLDIVRTVPLVRRCAAGIAGSLH